MELIRLVIVEDDVAIRNLLADVLKQKGGTIVGTANNLLDGMALVKETPCDCAVVDIDLAGDQALPLIELLEELSIPFVPITGLTLANIDSPRIRAMPLLIKPFDSHDLLDAIARACQMPPNAASS
jgi:two-component SAPR family response regulator